MKKENVFIAVLITVVGCWAYWMFVMSLANNYSTKANEYGMKMLLYQVKNMQKEQDSMSVLYHHYWELSDKTILAIPKFVRP